jgi:hypothetical protein
MTFYPTGGVQHIEELLLPYDPSQALEKVARRKRQVRSRAISLGITLAILVGLYLWQRNRPGGAGSLTVYLVVLGISVAWLVGFVLAYVKARRDLRGVGEGVALRMGRPGVELAGSYVPWSDVVSLAAVRGRRLQSPRLQLVRTSGAPLSVPFDQLDVRPATLDLTARAYSGGRHGVDLEALDS